MRKARVVKRGNSPAVRIPRAVAEELHLKVGDSITLRASDRRVTLRRAVPTLEELVAEITPENCYAEINSGHDVGKEIIEW